MTYVTLTHPDLPDQPISVHANCVRHYQRCGWLRESDVADVVLDAAIDGQDRPRRSKKEHTE